MTDLCATKKIYANIPQAAELNGRMEKCDLIPEIWTGRQEELPDKVIHLTL